MTTRFTIEDKSNLNVSDVPVEPLANPAKEPPPQKAFFLSKEQVERCKTWDDFFNLANTIKDE